jgi:signal peptidase I
VHDTPAPSDLPDDRDARPAYTRRRNVADARTAPRHFAAPGAGPSLGETEVAPEVDDDDTDERPPHSVGRTTLEWVGVIAFGILIALTARLFLVEVFWIPSESMVPTLQEGDRVLVNKLSYKTHDVHRGDVIVFERPPAASHPGQDEIKDLIKRVVAVGGDTIEARDGDVYVNGERIVEPYLVEGTPTNELPLTEVPEGQVFVMGDNRTNSEDSRVFGPIDEDTIVGRAIIKVLPPSDIGWL